MNISSLWYVIYGRWYSSEYHIFRAWLGTAGLKFLHLKSHCILFFPFSLSYKTSIIQSGKYSCNLNFNWQLLGLDDKYIFHINKVCGIFLALNAIVSHFWIYLYLCLIPLCGFVWWPLNSGILPFRERINLLCLPLSLLREISFYKFLLTSYIGHNFKFSFMYFAFVITWYTFSQMYWIIFHKYSIVLQKYFTYFER